MEEYTKLVTQISNELWKEFKPRISADMSTDDFWTDMHDTFCGIAEKYKGTVAEGYAVDMATVYMLQLQRIYRKDNKHGKWGELMDALRYLRTGEKPV